MIRAGLDQLQLITDEGKSMSLLGQALLDYAPLNNSTAISSIATFLAFMGMFFASLAYPLYCQLKFRKEH